MSIQKIAKIILFVLFSSIIFLYFGVVFLLPPIINNNITINKFESLIFKNTGIKTNITKLKLKISPKLVAVLDIDSVDAKKENISVIDIKNISLSYKLLQSHLTLVSADNIYVDGNGLKHLKKSSKKKKNGKFDFSKHPEIHINNLVYKSDEVSIYGKGIDTQKDILKLYLTISTPYLKETIKLGDSGNLQVIDNALKLNQFKISLGNSNLYLDGIAIADKDKSLDLSLKGKELPVSEIMPMLLHFQKSQDPSKKFIENFKNFKGTVNVDLKINNDGVFGKCVANKLGAKAVWFDIPLFFKEAIFNFRGKEIDSVAHGSLGKEKVTHTLNITKLGTPEKLVVGKMFTTLTKKFDSVPNLTVLNSVNVKLVYKIKYKKPDVYYDIDIPKNSDLIYNSFYLGLRDSKRKISANTFKDDNDLYLKNYKYSYSDSSQEKVIISGNGLFKKNIDKSNPDKFIPQYITCFTNGYAPISVTGSFGEKVKGGEFKGNIKYDFNNNQVLGTFDIRKARHKAFKIENAHIVAKNGVLNITSNGLYKGEKYLAEMSAKSNIYGETLIYNMKLLLDKLVFEATPDTNENNKNNDPKKFSKSVKDSEITINNWGIAVNTIQREKFILQNVKLLGSMKDNIFHFNMKELNFADGIIRAKGQYDFAKDTSKMTFEANNINSNKAANMMLNLQNQIEGTANAKVELDAKDMFRFLDVHSEFEIKEGFLPRLGDKEFMIDNTKYKISDITNLDLTQKDLLKDDIKGSFDVHNTELKNINITTWHKLSAVYLEGYYEMEKQFADLQLFWHYSKEAPKGVRIFGIPVSFILKVVFRPEKSKELYMQKLSQIPKIDADDKNSIYYRIQLKGDINNNKTSLVLKEIR